MSSFSNPEFGSEFKLLHTAHLTQFDFSAFVGRVISTLIKTDLLLGKCNWNIELD